MFSINVALVSLFFDNREYNRPLSSVILNIVLRLALRVFSAFNFVYNSKIKNTIITKIKNKN